MYENVKGRSATASLELAASAKTKFDEFLRRQLGISNAQDPASVVGALRKLYPSTAARLDDESRGVAIRQGGEPERLTVAPTGGMGSPGVLRYQLVRQALEADLGHVVEHPSNRDYKAPLTGWKDAVLAELSEGESAAYRAADPAQRDRTFYSVRKLGDYARVARMAGLLNPVLDAEFRRLASTMDEAAIVLRVLAGETMFRAGFDEGGTVFQVAFEDLRQRRETLIGALERFTSATHEGEEDWGDGEASYGALLRVLSEQGHSELRAIIRPETMTRLLDVLLDSVPQQQPDYLRGIASTVPLEMVQLRRLRAVATELLKGRGGRNQAASAPLSAFVQALTLFIDAFAEPGTGSRLLNISLPAPFASLQLARADKGGDIVRALFHVRTRLQVELDAIHADPNVDPLDWPLIVKLDRVLYDLDRAIDLYLMGGGNNLDGFEERRARMYAVMLQRWLDQKQATAPGDDWNQIEPENSARQQLRLELRTLVQTAVVELSKPPKLPPADEQEQFLQEQRLLEAEWRALAVELTQVATGRQTLVDLAGTLYVGVKGSLDAQEKIDLSLTPSERVSAQLLVKRHEELIRKVGETNHALKPLYQIKELPRLDLEIDRLTQELEQERKARQELEQKLAGASGVAKESLRVPTPRSPGAGRTRRNRKADSRKAPRAHSPEAPEKTH
ncbi:hypothetical protein [Hyalangium rubrum]|uniref:Uncharacterized protein n=1 Tax=Hyalangium rubrum TaxID=3103134 RepID=A0ABU5HDJ4_9BACT|nr:hypothetical protein [Hyalangium sp. s54d21]MDY7231331.1 hypothetical protein [Hyalangium sp. s54d21]